MAKSVENKKEKSRERYKVVSPRVPKLNKALDSADPMAKLIMGFFDDSLKKEFAEFLQERSKVIPISKIKTEKAKTRGPYSKEGKEPISFKELTSYHNPKFSAPGKWSPAEYNPETIDIDTFDLMRRDHQLAPGLAIIKLPIISLPWRIDCGDEKVRKTVEWAISKIWRDLVKSSLMAIDYGFATHEKVWERKSVKVSEIDKAGKEEIYYQGDLVYYKKIKPNHPGSIKMKFDDKQNLVEIIQDSDGMSDEVTLPVRKVFLFSNDKEYGNPFGTSRLKNAYKVWYWKELLYQFMMQYFERRGTPPTVATAPPGQSQDSSGSEIDNLELALRLATSLISSSVAVLPYVPNKEGRENMWDLKLLTDDARGPMFIEALKHLDARCLRAIFVPEGIITQEEKGGYGGSSVHADLFLMSEKGLITELEEAADKQIIEPFIEANYPPDKRREAHLKLDPLDFNRRITIKELFVEMLRNLDTMIQMSVEPNVLPDMEKMAEILEIPTETWESATGLKKGELAKRAEKNAKNVASAVGNKSGAEDLKVAGRKKTRGTSVNQTQDRKRINPGGNRADRLRQTNPEKKR